VYVLGQLRQRYDRDGHVLAESRQLLVGQLSYSSRFTTQLDEARPDFIKTSGDLARICGSSSPSFQTDLHGKRGARCDAGVLAQSAEPFDAEIGVGLR
jgi:hypothetical protein